MNAIGSREQANKIRIILEGLRGEESIAALCRREGIPVHRQTAVLRVGADGLENYYLPGALEEAVEALVEHDSGPRTRYRDRLE